MAKIDAVISLKSKMYEKQGYTEYGVLSPRLLTAVSFGY